MKLQLSLLAPALLAAALAVGTAQAMPGPDHCPGFAGGMAGELLPPPLHGLSLSEAQRDQVFTLLHNQAPVVREKMKALHKSREELRALAFSGQFDEGKAKSLAEAVARSEADLALVHARTDSQLAALLTPEQRRQLEELKAKPVPRPGHGSGDGMGAPR